MVVAIVIVILIIIAWIWYTNYIHPSCPSQWMRDIKFKTGDIILFKAQDHWRSAIIGYFTHVGIVVREDSGKLMLFEADLPNAEKMHESQNPDGIHYHDLYERLKKYNGRVYVRHCYETNLHYNALQDFIAYARNSMKYEPRVFNNFMRKILGDGYQNYTNCGELTLLSCMILGTIPRSYFNQHIVHHLYYCGTSLQPYYSPLIHIKIDPYDYC